MSKKRKKWNSIVETYNDLDMVKDFKPIYDEDINVDDYFSTIPPTNSIDHNKEIPLEEKSKKENGSSKQKLSMYSLAKMFVSTFNLIIFNGFAWIYLSGIYIRLTTAILINCLFTLPEEYLTQLYFNLVEDTLKFLTAMPAITHYNPNVQNLLFAWNDGMIDLRTGQISNLSPDVPIFSKVNISRWPGFNLHSKKFMKVLKTMSGGDSEVIQRILEFLGYCLLTSNPGKYFFLLGIAQESGKSKILAGLLRRFLGDEFISNSALDDLGGNFGMASIIGKRLNLSLDLPATTLTPKSVSRIKMLTGGDTVEINEKYKPQTNFENMATFVFGSNFPLRIKTPDDAFWNRLIFVPCLHSIPKDMQDENLINELWEDREAIVSMSLNAFRQVISNNMIFSPCQIADDIVASWKDELIDNVVRFVKCCCEFDESAQTHTRLLYDAYENWCFENGELVKTENYFARMLTNKFKLSGFRWKNEKQESLRGYKGIRLK